MSFTLTTTETDLVLRNDDTGKIVKLFSLDPQNENCYYDTDKEAKDVTDMLIRMIRVFGHLIPPISVCDEVDDFIFVKMAAKYLPEKSLEKMDKALEAFAFPSQFRYMVISQSNDFGFVGGNLFISEEDAEDYVILDKVLNYRSDIKYIVIDTWKIESVADDLLKKNDITVEG